MKCEEAMSRTAGRALDELEAGEKRRLEEHLAGCSSCRAGAELDVRTVAALRTLDVDESSEARRERAVAAMAAAHRDQAPVVAGYTRRRWMAVSVAAALLVALAVPLLLSRGGLSAERVDGTAWIQRAGAREYVAFQVGDTLRTGDRLKTESVVGLQGSGLKVIVNRNSQVSFDDGGRVPVLKLVEGSIFVESPKNEVTVVDPLDRRAAIRDGSAEVRLPIVASPTGEKNVEFVIHVDKGVVQVTGAKGSREAKSGEQWSVDRAGGIRDEPPGPIAPWRKQP
jgi:hypothetical protein